MLGLAETLPETVVCKVQVVCVCVCLGGGGEGVLVCDSVNCLLTLGGLGQQGLILSTPTGALCLTTDLSLSIFQSLSLSISLSLFIPIPLLHCPPLSLSVHFLAQAE